MNLWKFAKSTRRLYLTQRKAEAADTSYGGEFASIDRLLLQLSIRDGTVVDIAASDGVDQSSTLPLFRRGWAGLAVELDPVKFARLASIYAPFEQVRLARSRVTPANVAAMLKANEVPMAFDVLNLDIDSYDLFVIKAMLGAGYRPKIVSMEINEKIAPPVYFTVKYDNKHFWHGDHFHGCSLTAASSIMRAFGYILESLSYHNAVYVAPDYAKNIPDIDDATAYQVGYASRADRLKLFPWNADMDYLLALPPEQIVIELNEKFADYDGLYELRVDSK